MVAGTSEELLLQASKGCLQNLNGLELGIREPPLSSRAVL